MKATLVALGLLVLAGGVVWIFYPTSIPARQHVYQPVSPDEFRALRSLAIDVGRTLEGDGISLDAGDEASSSLMFSCADVPILAFMNNEHALVVMEFAGSEQRAPGFNAQAVALTQTLVRMRSTDGEAEMPAVPTGIEAFVLKSRDGLDLAARCTD